MEQTHVNPHLRASSLWRLSEKPVPPLGNSGLSRSRTLCWLDLWKLRIYIFFRVREGCFVVMTVCFTKKKEAAVWRCRQSVVRTEKPSEMCSSCGMRSVIVCQQMDACMDPTGGSWPTAQPLYTSPPPPHFTIFLEVNPASSSRWRRQRPRAVPSAAPVVMNDCTTVLGIRLDQCNPAAAAYAAARKSQIQQNFSCCSVRTAPVEALAPRTPSEQESHG